jgi:hypothetical protein
MVFSVHRRKIPGGAENLAEKSGPGSTQFFCYIESYTIADVLDTLKGLFFCYKFKKTVLSV